MHLRTRLVAFLGLATVLASCGGSTEPSPVLTTITVSLSPTTIMTGELANAIPSGLDQNGASIATGTVTWTTASTAVATVNIHGVVTGVAPGTTDVIATSGTRQGKATITVIPIPVASVVVTPASSLISTGETVQLTATPRDANANALTGRTTGWSSSDQTKATVSSTGLVTGVAPGSVTITASIEGKTATAAITVVASSAACTSATALQLAVGAMRVLTDSEKLSFCVGNASALSEYVLIPFHASKVAAENVQLQFTATKATALQSGAQLSLSPASGRTLSLDEASLAANAAFEIQMRKRQLQELEGISFAQARSAPKQRRTGGESWLLGIPPTPTVGSIVDINASVTGNTCSSPRQVRGARVAAVLPRTIVLIDTLAPAGGYTDAELTSFGQQFDTLAYDLAVANFGAPSDIDQNGRVAILFTPTINAVPVPPNVRIGGLFAPRDLFPPPNGCVASNGGEMFYIPVPDPGSTINGNYTDKTQVARGVVATLIHEFQHLINTGRRAYVNNTNSSEEVWLNEGLSHIAEELLYYRISGNSPRSNLNLAAINPSPAKLDIFLTYQFQNIGRLSWYLKAPETHSPYAQEDDLATRGAIWQLLRYAADRKGAPEQSTWFALVNASATGQANFEAVFGNTESLTRDWAIAQFTDDAGFPVAAQFTHPSWNFRSVTPIVSSNNSQFPLLARALLTTVDVTLAGGGAAYLRFGVNPNDPATIRANSNSQPVPTKVDFILVRTH